jgi:hypothetical protein
MSIEEEPKLELIGQHLQQSCYEDLQNAAAVAAFCA